jgi:ATP/maltotriose-dependent transcriptional regulator MalT
VCFVLDDVHEIPATSPGAALLELLVTELPGNGCLLLASRDVVPLATARLAASGALLRLTERDLVFDADELRAFAVLRGVDPTLLETSAGWPAIAELLASAGSDLVGDYLWEEVLARLGYERARELALFGLVGGGDDEVATAVAGRALRVDDLVAGVPLVNRAPSGSAVLHGLWAPVLRRSVTDDQGRAAAHLAAAVHRRRGRFGAAFDLLAEVEAWDDALEVVRDALTGPTLPAGIATAEPGRWFRSLPPDRRDAPEAQLAIAFELQTRSPLESLPAFAAAASGFRDRRDVDGELAAIAAEGLVRWWASDVDGLFVLHQRTTELAATGSPSAQALSAVGVAAIAHLAGDSTGVLDALAPVRHEHLLRWQPTVHWLRSVAHRRAGDLRAAHAELDAIDRLPGGSTDHQAQVARLRADWLAGDVDHIPDRLREIREHYRKTGDQFFEAELTLELASRLAWIGDLDAAATLVDDIDPALTD